MKEEQLVALNALLHEQVKEEEGVNLIRYLPVDDGKRCSVVCHYEEQGELHYPFGATGLGEHYYGLHPAFDTKRIISAIRMGAFMNEARLKAFLEEHADSFALHEEAARFTDGVFALAVIRMATRFGFRFQLSKGAKARIQRLTEAERELLQKDVTYTFAKNGDLFCLGGITEALLDRLTKARLVWGFDSEAGGLWMALHNERAGSRSFGRFYEETSNLAETDLVGLAYGSVYYSGVLPRVCDLTIDQSYSNPSVQTIRLTVERTTYATLDAFDNGMVIHHPLLRPYVKEIAAFFSMEDEAQKELNRFGDSMDRAAFLQSANAYLARSPNTHTLAVSGNIVDRDGKLLLGMRHASSIDSGTYYCSVNGQSEFLDDHVAFYKESVFEDYPSLVPNPSKRNGFNEELNRETKAELNLDELSGYWAYYGISMLGIRNRETRPDMKRRLHFNVLAFNRSEESFAGIHTQAKAAAEHFENQSIESLHIKIYRTQAERLSLGVQRVLAFFSAYNTIIASVFAVVFLLLAGDLASLQEGWTMDAAQAAVSFLLAIIILLNTLVMLTRKVLQRIRLRKYEHRSTFSPKGSPVASLAAWFYYERLIRKAHPITRLMLGLYILDQTDDKK